MEFKKNFEVIETFEQLKNNKKDNSNKMFTLVSWYESEPVFDIRWWYQYDTNFTNMPVKGKGITLNEEEMDLIVDHYLKWKEMNSTSCDEDTSPLADASKQED